MDFSIYHINIKEADLSAHVFKHETRINLAKKSRNNLEMLKAV